MWDANVFTRSSDKLMFFTSCLSFVEETEVLYQLGVFQKS